MIDFSTGVVNAKRGILLLLVHFNNDPLLHDDNDSFFCARKDALERWNLSGCITLSIFLKWICQLEIEKGLTCRPIVTQLRHLSSLLCIQARPDQKYKICTIDCQKVPSFMK